MKHGRLYVVAVGSTLVIVGVVAGFFAAPIAIAFVLIGLVVVVLGAYDWTEVEAQWNDFKVRISKQTAAAAASPERKPELKILSLEERGGRFAARHPPLRALSAGRRSRRKRAAVKASPAAPLTYRQSQTQADRRTSRPHSDHVTPAPLRFASRGRRAVVEPLSQARAQRPCRPSRPFSPWALVVDDRVRGRQRSSGRAPTFLRFGNARTSVLRRRSRRPRR